ncbi:hypothetical protein V2A60_000382 [Cordyceps javanica]
MSSIIFDEEPLVWHFAMQDEADDAVPGDDSDSEPAVSLLYLRIAGRRSIVLLRDTSEELMESQAPDNESKRESARRRALASQHPDRYVELKHDLISASAAPFRRDLDVILFTHETNTEFVNEMGDYYGTQLDAIGKVMFEGSSWNEDLDACLERMAVFNNVHTISVWLESDRFANNFESMTTKDYVAMALDFEARDKRMLKGRNVTVEYIDYNGTVHGTFRTGA